MKINYKTDQVKIIESWLSHLSGATGIDIILVKCSGCNELINAKLGHGVFGISDSLCPDCAAKMRAKIGVKS